jgi:hypothetical protein
MGASAGGVLAGLAVVMCTLSGCDSRGGGDPRQAPGCSLNALRCDGNILQICQIDTIERRKTWWDIHDCVDFGRDVGQAMTCVEQDAGEAACDAIPTDAGAEVEL